MGRISKWQTRLGELTALLRSEPDNGFAWSWRIEVRVLTYLLNRYAASPTEDLPSRDFPLAPFEFFYRPLGGPARPFLTDVTRKARLQHVASTNFQARRHESRRELSPLDLLAHHSDAINQLLGWHTTMQQQQHEADAQVSGGTERQRFFEFLARLLGRKE